jgi:hypothetical protein
MSIEAFTSIVKDKVYKDWLSELDKNIILEASKTLRAGEQTAPKTSFYVTKNQIRNIYKSITGEDLSDTTASTFIDNLYVQNQAPGGLNPTRISLDKDNGVLFKSIGWSTITELMSGIFENDEKVAEKYSEVTETYKKSETDKLQASAKYKSASTSEKRTMERKINEEAERRGTFGYFVNKGHVVSVATNLVIKFRDQVKAAEQFEKEKKDLLLEVLDKYISKLQTEDIANANLKGIDQSIYASYIKDTYGDGKAQYLAEFQFRLDNQAAGSASASTLNELSKVFGLSTEGAAKILENSPSLGQALLTTPGSPSFVQMLSDNLASLIETGKGKAKSYKTKSAEVAKRRVKTSNNDDNKKTIAELKKMRSKIQAAPTSATKIEPAVIEPSTDLVSLLALFNGKLREAIVKNMGTGTSTNVLNYRTGRFADSAKIQRLTESREGMITAFYSYMRNPYGTFSTGGRQEMPKSRDPKLLIAKSIRDIAVENIKNRLRAVNV